MRIVTLSNPSCERGYHVITSVILNLFQDLKRCRIRRSRNEFGMTDMMFRDDKIPPFTEGLHIFLRHKTGLKRSLGIFAFTIVQDAEVWEIFQQFVMFKAELAAPWMAGCQMLVYQEGFVYYDAAGFKGIFHYWDNVPLKVVEADNDIIGRAFYLV